MDGVRERRQMQRQTAATLGWLKGQPRSFWAALSVLSAVLAVLVLVVIALSTQAGKAANGSQTPDQSGDAVTTQPTMTAQPTSTPTPTPTPTPSPTPTPAAAPSPDPVEPANAPTDDAVAPGGDQPIGAQEPPRYGTIPENVNASAELLALKDALAQAIDEYRSSVGSIEVGIAVTDLQTGETISINGNRPQRTGCTINAIALLAAVGEFEAGRADPRDVAYSIRVGIGHSYPPEVRRFLVTVFGDYWSGVYRARELMAVWGMEASVFDHLPYYGDGTQNNLLTALEMNLVLSRLYHGELFTAEWTTYALARLREIKPGLNYMLPGQLPVLTKVAHKIGYYWDVDGWVNNDAGIVTFIGADGEEKAYAITYLSEKAPTEYLGYSFGSRLSRMVWDYFAATYGTGAAPVQAAQPAPALTPELTPAEIPLPTPETTLTPEPTATPQPSPSATPTPTPTPTVTPTPAPSVTPLIVPSPTPVGAFETPVPTPSLLPHGSTE